MLLISVLVILGLGSEALAQSMRSWKDAKENHLLRQPKLTRNDVLHFAHKRSQPDNFKQHLRKILQPRVPGSAGSQRVRKHIRSTMTSLGWSVSEDHHIAQTPLGGYSMRNVIATLDPSAPRRLLLACHYDSKREPDGFLAMTDSAVPCAQMLNLATAMQKELNENTRRRNDVTLQLVFFDGEEAFVKWSKTDSLYGSRFLAARWANESVSINGVLGKELERIDLFVLLDLIGTTDTQFAPLQRSGEFPYARLASFEAGLRDVEDSLPRSCMSRRRYNGRRVFGLRKMYSANIEDDHVPFLNRGVPILHLISVPFPKVWHKSSDNLSAVDYERTEFISALLRMLVAEYLGMAGDGQRTGVENSDPCQV